MLKRLLVIGCILVATAGPAYAASAPSLKRYSGADKGDLVLSAYGLGATFIRIKRIDSPGQSEFGIYETVFTKAHFVEDPSSEKFPELPTGWEHVPNGGRGFVYDIPLPPGQYEIDQVKAEIDGLFRLRYFATSKTGFNPISFEIQPGRVTYLGRYYTFEVEAKSLLGVKMPRGAMVILKNKADQDLELASRRFPQLNVRANIIWVAGATAPSDVSQSELTRGN